MQKNFNKIALTLSLTVLMGISIGCGNQESKQTTAPPQGETQQSTPTPATTMDKQEIDRFNTYVPNIKGGSFIKQAEIKDNSATILFVKDYAELKSVKPENKITEDDYKNYWSKGDAINKTLSIETVRLFKEFEGLSKINMVLPFQGKEYNLSVDRKAVEEFFNLDLTSLKQTDKWQNDFLAKYDNTEERAKFVQKFVQTK
ncbi:hypothetical protein [Desulfosporosinus youngiae]|uniref:DUF4825 domain-containing protein n=1 Tax=Desulfosporosinus youngiae DSM 17734 TaxID=768710 RepID=H5XVP8_9FIRM|nr:hypothetical protein [Desulfosporosinus youngiae]EHQ90204.1 hypothetical protein DesyoDRAFT_3171 [Desulfosporosinus youngiae DSM 17734]